IKDVFSEPGESTERTNIDKNWWLLGPMRLSHLCLKGTDDKCVGRIVDWQDASSDLEDGDKQLLRLRFAHTVASVASAPGGAARQADERLLEIHRSLRKSRGNADATIPVETLWGRIAQLLPRGSASDALPPLSRGSIATDAAEAGDGVANTIIGALAKARAVLKPSGAGDYVDGAEIGVDDYYGLKAEARFIDPRTIRQTAQWQVGEERYWLATALFDYGASSRNWLFLLHGTAGGPTKLVDLTHRLRFKVGRLPSGLDEHGNLEITEDFATTMGFGGWPRSIDRVRVVRDRYLVASGLWTIDSRRWVLVYDLGAEQILYFNRDLPEAPAFVDLALTEDGRLLVQTNGNGHFYIYDVARGALALEGVDIDDELVIYDPRGYYGSTPEAAQFVFLKYPGLPGYQSFRQFARTLSRPDVIAAALAGRRIADEPRLSLP
ncbi:MAG: hypothetical protein JSS20_20565, partial [Proteobacteria bacterium]|nr:hypothetical protein [Pseudomonadota bacterium]